MRSANKNASLKTTDLFSIKVAERLDRVALHVERTGVGIALANHAALLLRRDSRALHLGS
jgi:hypothetical protein